MTHRPPASLAWMYLAVLAPLILLASLAWWGTRSQLNAAWAEARTEAELLATREAAAISEKLASSFRKIPAYPSPPIPGTESPADAILEGTDTTALATLRDNPNAGTSPAGLPRRALAALRIHHLAPSSPQSPSLLTELFTTTAPSVLTTIALEKTGAAPSVLADWTQSEQIRQHARTLTPGTETWLPLDIPTFIRKTQTTLEYTTIPPGAPFTPLPAWATARTGFPNTSAPGTLLATAPLTPGSGLNLHIHASPRLIEAPVRLQQKWTFAILSAALLTAAISLAIIHRTVSRERHLAHLKSQFVASVSHELRAPLGSIRLMAESLQQGKTSRPAEFHNLIARESARLSHLIENVLDFARIEEGKKHYRFEETDLTALIHDTLRLIAPLAEQRKVTITTDLPEINATLDPSAIQQALINLLDNALKFSPENGTINLRCLSENETTHIHITDQGPGIPASEHTNIFQRFHRLGNELRRETQGTGIGLSIVQHIAHAHHGEIKVASTPPHGSTFTLSIPPLPPCASSS